MVGPAVDIGADENHAMFDNDFEKSGPFG